MPTPRFTIERFELKPTDWIVDLSRNILAISTHLDDQQAAAAEREAFSALQAVEQD